MTCGPRSIVSCTICKRLSEIVLADRQAGCEYTPPGDFLTLIAASWDTGTTLAWGKPGSMDCWGGWFAPVRAKSSQTETRYG